MAWDWPIIISALGLGVGSSLHCLGMCGPLVMSLPFARKDSNKLWPQFALYTLSKASSYGALGLLPGLVGWSIKGLSSQVLLSIVSGLFVLLLVFVPSVQKSKWMPTAINTFIVDLYQKVLQKSKWYHFAGAGMLNGLLPCAMVWIALSASAATGHPLNAFVFMFIFGLGTIPALGMVMFSKTWYTSRYKLRIQFASRYLAILMGLFLILRGILVTLPSSQIMHFIPFCSNPEL